MQAQSSTAEAPLVRGTRLGVRAAIGLCALSAEILFLSYLVQGRGGIVPSGAAIVVRDLQHWLFRLFVAYAGSLAILAYLGPRKPWAGLRAVFAAAPVRPLWGAAHALLLAPLAVLSARLYHGAYGVPFWALAVAWHLIAAATMLALLAALAPRAVWAAAWRAAGALRAYALLPAVGAVLAIHWSQALWAPAAAFNFRLVDWFLRPFYPALHSDAATMLLGTDRFAVTVSAVCSGFEGVGLMLVFCAAWLWLFRREYRFPHALIMIPAGVALVFLLNALRIAALIAIGDAGYPRIAVVGFHSQAGWIAFNFAAFSIALLARHSPWLRRAGAQPRPRTRERNPPAPYLMPLLVILAAGMLGTAMSAGFDWFYPLRLVVGLAVLWAYRGAYRQLDWRFGWRGILAGIGLFGAWLAAAHGLVPAAAMPAPLAQAASGPRVAWIICRIAAATISVPIAEELAYRGYLMRRLAQANFESVAFKAVRWPALALSSVAFGVVHGPLWPIGIAGGVLLGWIAIKTDRIGDAVAAHATANALLAVAVIAFGQWQLW